MRLGRCLMYVITSENYVLVSDVNTENTGMLFGAVLCQALECQAEMFIFLACCCSFFGI